MPKKGIPTRSTISTKENDNQISIKNLLNNLDDKTKRKIEYSLKDFKLQRQESLDNIEDKKDNYFNIIDMYYAKIPKIIPSRCFKEKIDKFDFENAYLILEVKKYLNPNLLPNLNRRKDVIKYGGTPAKFKVTYSATKRKSMVKSEIKHFELKRLSANGNKTLISSTKKCSTTIKSRTKNNIIRSMNNRIQDQLNNYTNQQQIENSLEEEKQLIDRMKTFKLSKIKENGIQLNEIKEQQINYIDNLFNNILNSLTDEQANQKITIDEQKNLIQKIYGF